MNGILDVHGILKGSINASPWEITMNRKGPPRDLKKELFWRGILRQHRESGLNIRDFCRKKGSVCQVHTLDFRAVLGTGVSSFLLP